MEPEWVRHAIWWQLYPLGFLGADTSGAATAETGASPRRTLADLEPWLDYAVALGTSGIALGPIFASGSHGYDTADHFAIDARLGHDASFAALVEACRARGLRLLLDGVFNHVGRDFDQFRQAVAGSAGARAWFLPTGDDFATFEGHHGLVTLNHGEPAVVEHVVSVMTHWLDAGAHGWRLDAAYAVPPAFWAQVLPRVRAAHPDAYLVGEVIHGDYEAVVAETSMDAVTQYELWKAIWSSIRDANFFELAWALERHGHWLETFAPLTFVGNHDVSRLASTLTDARHVGHALAVLFTVGGTPSIYYGDERAARGVKEERVGGDDAVRPQFPGEPGPLDDEGERTYRLHQLLIGFRRRQAWLHEARTSTVQLANAVFGYESRHGEHRIVTALNLSDESATVQVPAGLTEVLSADGAASIHGENLVVPAHEWAIAY